MPVDTWSKWLSNEVLNCFPGQEAGLPWLLRHLSSNLDHFWWEGRGLLLLLLRLLLSRFSRVRLCVTPSTAAHQAPPSLGFSRQEHWSGLPFPSPMHESEEWKWSCSVVSDSLRPHGLQPTRLLHPWDFPGKSTGVGCHCLLRGRGFPLAYSQRWLSPLKACLSFSRQSLEQRTESMMGNFLWKVSAWFIFPWYVFPLCGYHRKLLFISDLVPPPLYFAYLLWSLNEDYELFVNSDSVNIE